MPLVNIQFKASVSFNKFLRNLKKYVQKYKIHLKERCSCIFEMHRCTEITISQTVRLYTVVTLCRTYNQTMQSFLRIATT